jgi:flavin-dependent dehydrogenase
MTKDTIQNESDVVVIGGGPAGATVSTLLAQRGLRVQLFERERFPRYHIGESLIPETYWVFERLGMLEKLRASGFVEKRSVQFVSSSGKQSAPFYFWDNKPHESSQTWQVVRSEFDRLMLENAREHGVLVHEGVRVRDVLMEDERAVGIEVQAGKSKVHEVRARVVVDASGQTGVLMNKLGLRLWDPLLDKGAIWSYWNGAYREIDRAEGATLVLQTADRKGWFWYIPLHDDRTSVGVVKPFDDLFRGRGSHEQVFLEEVEHCPAVRERLAGAQRATGYFATKDYSYRSTKCAGDGWVLVGDAFGFLDPLYSSGVMLALKSGELAADAIVEGIAKNDLGAAQLGKWGPLFNQGVDRMRRLVCEYYDGFSFGQFARRYPDLRGKITDLLIGDLFHDGVDEVWQPLESLYPEGKAPPVGWDEGTPDGDATKANELLLPEGPRP